MLIADDVLFLPVKGVLWILKEVYNAALQEKRNEAEMIRTELSRIYRLLEAGEIAEADFDLREKELLDRLDAIESGGDGLDDGDAVEDEGRGGVEDQVEEAEGDDEEDHRDGTDQDDMTPSG